MFGIHSSLSSFLAKKDNFNHIQIFTKNPRSNFSFSKLTKDKCQEFKINVIIHAPYTLNFCKSKKEWRNSLIEDLQISSWFNQSTGVVIHLGKNTDKLKNPIDFMSNELIQVINESKNNSKILLETSCGQGTEICFTLNDLAKLIKSLEIFKNRIGVCIDTAHIFAAGYDIRKKEGIEKYLKEFDEKIGISYFNLLHLNDSKKKLNSKVDRHASIGNGEIYKNKDDDGLEFLINFTKELKIPIILETGPPKSDSILIKFM